MYSNEEIVEDRPRHCWLISSTAEAREGAKEFLVVRLCIIFTLAMQSLSSSVAYRSRGRLQSSESFLFKLTLFDQLITIFNVPKYCLIWKEHN